MSLMLDDFSAALPPPAALAGMDHARPGGDCTVLYTSRGSLPLSPGVRVLGWFMDDATGRHRLLLRGKAGSARHDGA